MNNEELTVRFADVTNLTDADYEVMAALSRDAFSEYKKESNLNFRGVTMTAAYVRGLANRGTHFFLVYSGDKLLAYCGAEMMTDRQGRRYMHSQGIATHPEYRRMHLGRRLTRLREQWGREQGAEFFDLDTSCKAAQALAFHKKNEYKVWAYIHHANTNYYSVIMQKDVTVQRTEWQRYKSVICSWIKVHLSVNEAGEPRPVGAFFHKIGGFILRLIKRRNFLCML